jgi:excisionase family DNA binding protein
MQSVVHKKKVSDSTQRKPRTRDPVVPQAYSVPDAAAVLAISKTNAYDLIKRNLLPARKIGSRTVVTHEELMLFLASTPRR